jgi:hypothetical protein
VSFPRLGMRWRTTALRRSCLGCLTPAARAQDRRWTDLPSRSTVRREAVQVSAIEPGTASLVEFGCRGLSVHAGSTEPRVYPFVLLGRSWSQTSSTWLTTTKPANPRPGEAPVQHRARPHLLRSAVTSKTTRPGVASASGAVERRARPITATSSRRPMPGSEGRPGGGTWDLWPLATAGLGGMLTALASSDQARQAPLATRGMSLLDPTGRSEQVGGRRRDRHGTRATGGPPSPVRPRTPLRRLTSIQDRTAPDAGDSLAEPTMAAGPISRRSAASPPDLMAGRPTGGRRGALLSHRRQPDAPGGAHASVRRPARGRDDEADQPAS